VQLSEAVIVKEQVTEELLEILAVPLMVHPVGEQAHVKPEQVEEGQLKVYVGLPPVAEIVAVKLEPLKAYQVVPGTGVNLNWSG
jgi:hypothetical protein